MESESTIAQPSSTINVQEFINAQKIAPLQVLIIVLCFSIVFIDGFTGHTLGFIGPALRKSWHLSTAQMGPLMGTGQFGLLVGALIFGPMADKLGRRSILCLSVLFFSFFSLAAGFAGTLSTLTLVYFFSGAGLGGAMPNTITMTSEFVPQRKRSSLTVFMFCGYSLGGTVNGIVAAYMIPAYGWQSLFILGGVVPLLLLLVYWFLLPESPRFLALAKNQDRAIARILRRISPQPGLENAKFVVAETKLGGFPVKHLFNQDFRVTTILLWIVYFMDMAVIGFVSGWLPTLVGNTGASMKTAALIASLYYAAAVVTAVSAGFLMDRLNPFKCVAVALFISGVGILSLGLTHIAWLFAVCVFLAGASGGSLLAINGLTPQLYPTSVRASGSSWALGIGRGGAVLGGLLGGYLLAAHWGLSVVLVLVSIPCFIAALAIFLLRARRLEGAASAPPQGQAAARAI